MVGKQIQHAALDPPRPAFEAELGALRHRRLLQAERGLGLAQWAVPVFTGLSLVQLAHDDLRRTGSH